MRVEPGPLARAITSSAFGALRSWILNHRNVESDMLLPQITGETKERITRRLVPEFLLLTSQPDSASSALR